MTKKRILVPRAIFPSTITKLREHFDVEYHELPTGLDESEFAAALADKAGVLTTTEDKIGALLVEQCRALEICANMAVGYNNLDTTSLAKKGVVVTNTPDVLTESTADFAMALLLTSARRVCEANAYLRSGLWKSWRYDLLIGADVHGATLGILGMGRIGQAIARRAARGFNMRVIYHGRKQIDPELERRCDAKYVDKATLFQTANFVILALPYAHELHHTVAAKELSMMRRDSILVNVGRGGLIDETALAQALQDGMIAAAALDVFENEPHVDQQLLQAPNLLMTPHIASGTVRTRERMANLAADNLISYLTRGVALTPVTSLTG
jgi:glyoxylate/hydroxypyruvate/2-ketogluconate reductase